MISSRELKVVCLAAAIFWSIYIAPLQADAPITNNTESKLEGDLGGVYISVPMNNVRNVDFDSPALTGGKKKIAGFTLIISTPADSGIEAPDWRASVTSGSVFPGAGFLDRISTATIDRGKTNVEALTAQGISKFGLQTYSPIPTGHGLISGEREFYIHRTTSGAVDAFIWCSTRIVAAPPCDHTFTMEPNMVAKIQIHYPVSQLKHWRKLQEITTTKILSYRK